MHHKTDMKSIVLEKNGKPPAVVDDIGRFRLGIAVRAPAKQL
jgi:hypothetical protein